MTSVDTIFGKTNFGDEISDVGFDIEKVSRPFLNRTCWQKVLFLRLLFLSVLVLIIYLSENYRGYLNILNSFLKKKDIHIYFWTFYIAPRSANRAKTVLSNINLFNLVVFIAANSTLKILNKTEKYRHLKSLLMPILLHRFYQALKYFFYSKPGFHLFKKVAREYFLLMRLINSKFRTKI